MGSAAESICIVRDGKGWESTSAHAARQQERLIILTVPQTLGGVSVIGGKSSVSMALPYGGKRRNGKCSFSL